MGLFSSIAKAFKPSSSSPRTSPPNPYSLTTRVLLKEFQTDSGLDLPYFSIQVIGPLPHEFQGGLLSVTTSILDVTDSDPMLIHTGFDQQQESQTRVFLEHFEHGTVATGLAYTDWVEIGRAFVPPLDPPHSGARKLSFLSRWIHPAGVDKIIFGFLEDGPAVYGYSVAELTYRFVEAGYVERYENEIRCQEISVMLAINVALIDGDLHDDEGKIIQTYARKFTETFTGDQAEEIKTRMNAAMKRGFEQGGLAHTKVNLLTEEFRGIAAQLDIYELLELLVDVMSSDTLAHKDEVGLINEIGDNLGVSTAEIQELKDKRVMGTGATVLAHEDLESELGIDTSMSNKEILAYIREEFVRWNGRLASVTDESQKKIVQERLELLTEANTRYELKDAA